MNWDINYIQEQKKHPEHAFFQIFEGKMQLHTVPPILTAVF